ncbi:MAG: hypothetical protein IK075_08860 [Prevotella sp.]|nr:hypothetical protein [Prevotella sp.]
MSPVENEGLKKESLRDNMTNIELALNIHIFVEGFVTAICHLPDFGGGGWQF